MVERRRRGRKHEIGAKRKDIPEQDTGPGLQGQLGNASSCARICSRHLGGSLPEQMTRAKFAWSQAPYQTQNLRLTVTHCAAVEEASAATCICASGTRHPFQKARLQRKARFEAPLYLVIVDASHAPQSRPPASWQANMLCRISPRCS